jgi:outer membrane lipopolysaccharide assembly protein LptE/RlpB
MKKTIPSFVFISMLLWLLQSCSGSGFQLRKNATLPSDYINIALQGIESESDLYKTLQKMIVDAGGQIVPLLEAHSVITVSNLKQDKKIVAYTGQRIAREYMMYLRFDYQLKRGANKLQSRLIHLDKTLIYDANFILGKAEEEFRIQQSLREEAARLILLRLRYAKN